MTAEHDRITVAPPAANVRAECVNTLGWIRTLSRIAVPVYQRDYRWSPDSCLQLLDDVRSAGQAESRAHFMGSILTTGETGEVTLVDGQQRLTTIYLMLLALREAALNDDSAVVRDIEQVLFSGGNPSEPRLIPHAALRDTFAQLLASHEESTLPPVPFAQNFAMFVDHVSDDWATVWAGLNRLDHVVITLGSGPGASPQQVFESLNSTGESLANHELIHNHILMGLNHIEQVQVERDWRKMEELTSDQGLERFWRDYLILSGIPALALRGQYGLYRGFKGHYRDLGSLARVREHMPTWLRHAEWFRVLQRPEEADHLGSELQLHLGYVRDHFTLASPLVLGLYREFGEVRLNESGFLEFLELIQTLLLRRELQRRDSDLSLMATLIKSLGDPAALRQAIVERTPVDGVATVGLKQYLPKSGYVLGRLLDQTPARMRELDLEIEHIFPQTPAGDWTSGPGGAPWEKMSPDEQGDYRQRLNTLGNLTLLESWRNQAAQNHAFERKRIEQYRGSLVDDVEALSHVQAWGIEQIDERLDRLTRKFLAVWPRINDYAPVEVDDELTHFRDLPSLPNKMGDYPGLFDYVEFEGQTLPLHSIHELWDYTLDYLWCRRREELLSYQAVATRLVVAGRKPRGYVLLEPERTHSYYGHMAWWQYYVDELTQIFESFDLDVRLKISDQELAP